MKISTERKPFPLMEIASEAPARASNFLSQHYHLGAAFPCSADTHMKHASQMQWAVAYK